MPMSRGEFERRSADFDRWCKELTQRIDAYEVKYGRPNPSEERMMIADCETCVRKQVPCKSCQESQRAICFICQGDVADPYCETVTDWEDVEQLTNVVPWCDACQSNHWTGQCDPDLDEQRMPG